MSENASNRSDDECPECGDEGIPNPVLEDEYECNNCVVAFNSDGEVTARE